MLGGYQIVDLKNITLSGTTVTIPGIHSLITGTRKPLLFQNVVIDVSGTPTPYRDFFGSVGEEGSSLVVKDFVQKLTMYINSNDKVSGYNDVYIEASMIPINDTLELDGNGDLGVASN